jgi:hypothetical protein
MAIEVRDHLSNAPEHIEALAKALGKGDRVTVFKAIYHHKKRIKTVSELMEATGLTRVRILQCGGELASRGFVEQETKDGETAYKTIKFFQINKKRVLKYHANPKLLEKLPTKRKPGLYSALPRIVALPTRGARVKRITIDDIDSFSKVRTIRSRGSLPDTVSEEDFKKGVQSLLGEAGEFKDWGGENSDLYSTRLRMKGKRRAVTFAFKGPGTRTKLVPAKMGKNGDQAQRMFRLDADVFIAQHWREIDSSVLELMRALAVSRSQMTGDLVMYGIIDGQDSERLRRAYPKYFPSDD